LEEAEAAEEEEEKLVLLIDSSINQLRGSL
jgi:hypothetical protein